MARLTDDEVMTKLLELREKKQAEQRQTHDGGRQLRAPAPAADEHGGIKGTTWEEMSAFLRGLMSTPETRRFHTIGQMMRLMQEERPGQVTDIIKYKNKFDRLILELPEVVPEAQVTAMMIHNLDTPHRDAMHLGEIPQT
ncbi:hypothetical protein IMZ48_39780, partial [Candidatus Bathyarchaeota archaeon]|nr:hypothetical protein [Candidatus Bathyarchaeota archaeon]